jgi:hypothetical protein
MYIYHNSSDTFAVMDVWQVGMRYVQKHVDFHVNCPLLLSSFNQKLTV